MNICNECLNKKFNNAQSFGKSYGLCEICNETKLCNMIQSSRLTPLQKRPYLMDYQGGTITVKDVVNDILG